MDKSGFAIKAESVVFNNLASHHVSNFSIDSDVCETPFQALEKLVAWINDEFGENFRVEDLSDLSNYDPDWEREI